MAVYQEGGHVEHAFALSPGERKLKVRDAAYLEMHNRLCVTSLTTAVLMRCSGQTLWSSPSCSLQREVLKARHSIALSLSVLLVYLMSVMQKLNSAGTTEFVWNQKSA